jgi:hypothetical protein
MRSICSHLTLDLNEKKIKITRTYKIGLCETCVLGCYYILLHGTVVMLNICEMSQIN